nr:increased DNA methylation 1-like [Coffea arabica]
MKEPRTKRDLVEDVIFSRWSELNRLNFQGFYTVVLERDDDLITVATVRVYGEKVAEIPLVATRFQYRRLGMCRIMMNELEKKLIELGVQRLVLPAVPSVLSTWETSFGFSRITESERLNFLDCTFLDFQGSHMCQKLLKNTQCTELSQLTASLVILLIQRAEN